MAHLLTLCDDYWIGNAHDYQVLNTLSSLSLFSNLKLIFTMNVVVYVLKLNYKLWMPFLVKFYLNYNRITQLDWYQSQ